MGSVVDFLFEGSAPTPGSKTSTTQLQLPEWYTSYATDLLGRAQAVGNLPYATYTGPRIAGFTPEEMAGFEATKAGAAAYKPFLTQTQEALGKAGGISGYGAAAGDLGRAASMSGAGAAQPYLTSAAGMSGAGAAQPYFGAGMEAIQKGGAGSSLAAAQPYLGAAGRTFPQAAAEYMDPYTKAVVEQIGEAGVQQLQEKYLPAVGQEFIQAGQFGVGPGSTRMGEFGARALRDVQKAVIGEQAKALQTGYGQAADIFARDVDRAAALAGTVGKLSADDYSRLLESGARVADIGAKMGQLTSDDASRLAEIGKAAGTLTAQDAELLARIGETKGKLSLEDSKNLQDLASKYLTTAEASQIMGTREGEAITGVGEKKRKMQQANLELAYQDFLTQQGYPKEQVKFLATILSGIQLPKIETTQTTEVLPTAGGESAIEKAIKGGAGVSEIIDLIKKYFPSESGSSSNDEDIYEWIRKLTGI